MLPALLLLAAPLLAPPPRQVARLELAAPRTSPFVLRACVPIEKGVFPRADGRSPFLVKLPASDALVRAQAEVVSRYPGGDADVVEIVAPAAFDADVRPGARVTCGLFLDTGGEEAPAGEPALSERVRALLDPTARGRIGLRTSDVYGNAYQAELSGNPDGLGRGVRALCKQGAHLLEARTYATLEPLPGQGQHGAPLPHMMGVHAYWTASGVDDVVLLSLRVNNGASAGNRPASALESPLGIVYWTKLELVLPKEWVVVPEVADPFLGEARVEGEHRVVPLVKRNPDGSLHMMGPQAQFERRLALAPEGLETVARGRLAFDGWAFPIRGESLWSWSNPRTARYFAQRTVLASIDFLQRREKSGKAAARAEDELALAELVAALQTGTARGWYVTSGVMGWAHPWFTEEQGGVGGEGITPIEGHYTAQGASQAGLALLALANRMNVCRQPQALFDARGEIVGYYRWLSAEGLIPFDYPMNGGVVVPPFRLPMRYGPPASAQVRDVVARGLRPAYDVGTPYEKEGAVPYRGSILSWWPHDDQHLIRYTRNQKALAWLANDEMAKDDLRLTAELCHLAFHESPHVPVDWSAGVTLAVYEELARRFPHGGLPMGREHAWFIDTMCAAYSLGTPEWRAQNRAWFDRVTRLLQDAAMPSGLIQRTINVRLLGHEKYCAAQTFEHFFLIHAMRCLSESVYREVDEARRTQLGALARRGAEYLFFGPPWQRVQSGWQPDPAHPTIFEQGPRQGIAVSLNDERATPVFSDAARFGSNYLPEDGLGLGVETWTVWTPLQYLADWTEGAEGKGLDNRWRRRALDCGVPRASYAELLNAWYESTSEYWRDNTQNWIGFAGELQNLGVK